MKILLVGNSSIDTTKKVGETINNFDLVFRMNRFELDGFEEYLGNKTDVWILNRAISLGISNVHYKSLSKKFEERKVISQSLDKILMMTYFRNEADYIDIKQRTQSFSDFKVGDTRQVSEYLKKEWDKRMDKKFYKPGTGIIAIHYLLEKYGNITIHNFDCGETKHYWGDKDLASEPMSSKHDWSFDKILISELVTSERVSYL